MNPVRRVDVCKRGHDQTIEGARNAANACIKCRKIRDAKRQAQRPQRPVVIKKSVPAELIAELVALQELSSKTNRYTPIGHEYRVAGDLLAELLTNAMDEYDVNTYTIGEQMKLSPQTLRFFLMRRGAIPITPGVERNMGSYKNGQESPRKTACNQGHDYTVEDARDAYGACRECRRQRQRVYDARRRAA